MTWPVGEVRGRKGKGEEGKERGEERGERHGRGREGKRGKMGEKRRPWYIFNMDPITVPLRKQYLMHVVIAKYISMKAANFQCSSPTRKCPDLHTHGSVPTQSTGL